MTILVCNNGCDPFSRRVEPNGGEQARRDASTVGPRDPAAVHQDLDACEEPKIGQQGSVVEVE
jgi:hypothetical protein